MGTWHQVTITTVVSLLAMAVIACGGGDDSGDADVRPLQETATPASPPTKVPGVELAPFKEIDAGGGLTLASSGGPTLMVVVEKVDPAATTPLGWRISGAVRSIEARKQGRLLTSFDAALELRFTEKATLARVMRQENGQWVFAESTVNGDGTVSALITRPGTFAVMTYVRKTNIDLAGRFAPTPAAEAVARHTLTPATPTITPKPSVNKSQTPYPTSTARPTITPTPVRGSEELDALARKEIKTLTRRLLGHEPVIETVLPYEIVVGGSRTTMFYATYEGANELIVNSHEGLFVGGGYIIIEPQYSLPATAESAEAELLDLFPGMRDHTFKQEPNLGTLIFTAAEAGGQFYTLGFSMIGGVPVAFVASGYEGFDQLGYFGKTRIPK